MVSRTSCPARHILLLAAIRKLDIPEERIRRGAVHKSSEKPLLEAEEAEEAERPPLPVAPT